MARRRGEPQLTLPRRPTRPKKSCFATLRPTNSIDGDTGSMDHGELVSRHAESTPRLSRSTAGDHSGAFPLLSRQLRTPQMKSDNTSVHANRKDSGTSDEFASNDHDSSFSETADRLLSPRSKSLEDLRSTYRQTRDVCDAAIEQLYSNLPSPLNDEAAMNLRQEVLLYELCLAQTKLALQYKASYHKATRDNQHGAATLPKLVVTKGWLDECVRRINPSKTACEPGNLFFELSHFFLATIIAQHQDTVFEGRSLPSEYEIFDVFQRTEPRPQASGPGPLLEQVTGVTINNPMLVPELLSRLEELTSVKHIKNYPAPKNITAKDLDAHSALRDEVLQLDRPSTEKETTEYELGAPSPSTELHFRKLHVQHEENLEEYNEPLEDWNVYDLTTDMDVDMDVEHEVGKHENEPIPIDHDVQRELVPATLAAEQHAILSQQDAEAGAPSNELPRDQNAALQRLDVPQDKDDSYTSALPFPEENSDHEDDDQDTQQPMRPFIQQFIERALDNLVRLRQSKHEDKRRDGHRPIKITNGRIDDRELLTPSPEPEPESEPLEEVLVQEVDPDVDMNDPSQQTDPAADAMLTHDTDEASNDMEAVQNDCEPSIIISVHSALDETMQDLSQQEDISSTTPMNPSTRRKPSRKSECIVLISTPARSSVRQRSRVSDSGFISDDDLPPSSNPHLARFAAKNSGSNTPASSASTSRTSTPKLPPHLAPVRRAAHRKSLDPSSQLATAEEMDKLDQEEYPLVDIIDEKEVKGEKKYLIKWQPINGRRFLDTWEPAENANAAAVQDWERLKKRRQQRKERAKRTTRSSGITASATPIGKLAATDPSPSSSLPKGDSVLALQSHASSSGNSPSADSVSSRTRSSINIGDRYAAQPFRIAAVSPKPVHQPFSFDAVTNIATEPAAVSGPSNITNAAVLEPITTSVASKAAYKASLNGKPPTQKQQKARMRQKRAERRVAKAERLANMTDAEKATAAHSKAMSNKARKERKATKAERLAAMPDDEREELENWLRWKKDLRERTKENKRRAKANREMKRQKAAGKV